MGGKRGLFTVHHVAFTLPRLAVVDYRFPAGFVKYPPAA